MNVRDIVLYLLNQGESKPPFPLPPTRDALLGGQCWFQGNTCATKQYGVLPMFEPAVNWLDLAEDRAAWYARKRAVGDTIANFTLSGQYREGGQAYANIPGVDFSKDLPLLRDRIVEAITTGGMIGVWLMLAGDGEGDGPGYNDPQGMTYGFGWLMKNFAAVHAALLGDGGDGPTGNLTRYVVFVPGYDGVVPAWQPPSQVDQWLLYARSVVGEAGYLGLELSAGYSSWGDGGENWTSPAGKACDLILQEFPYPMGPPTPAPADVCTLPNDEKAPWYQVWQIVARMIKPYLWPSDEPPCADNPHPPFYLAGGTPRGPFYYNAWEYDTYGWVRWCPVAQVDAHRQALKNLGCHYVG